MKSQKKGFSLFWVLLSLAFLEGCSASVSESGYGTEENPAGVGQTVVYDGTEASKDKNRFKAEITLEDVVRGEEAEDIFAAAGGMAPYREPLELEDNQELLIARFTFTIMDMPEDMLVDIGERDVHMFKLVSQDGADYDYFLQRRYMDGNLFLNGSRGSTQTGCIFYLVDIEDENPNIVFLPSVNEGVWFKTVLTDKDKEQVEKPILASDWLGGEQEGGISYGGTFNAPLPVGEYGYMHCQSTYYGEFEIEVRLDDFLRGDEAEDMLERIDRYGDAKRKLGAGQEYLLVKFTVNLPSADLLEESFFQFDAGDCGLINSSTGTEYDYENTIDFMTGSVNAMLPGGSSEGWFGFVIDKSDTAPMLYYGSPDDKMLFFRLEDDYKLPEDREKYKSVLSKKEIIRDDSKTKGDWRNPYGMGDSVELDYQPTYDYAENYSFTGSMEVLEAYRGETAQQILGEMYDYGGKEGAYREPVVVKLRVKVKEAEGQAAPGFGGSSFTVVSGRGGEVVTDNIYNTAFAEGGLNTVYPGGTAEGYVGFYVPEGTGAIEISYGKSYDNLKNTWIELEFTDTVIDYGGQGGSEETAGGSWETQSQEDGDSLPGIETYTVERGNNYSKETYNFKVHDGQVLACTQTVVYFYEDNPELFESNKEEAADIELALNYMEGVKGSCHWDEEALTISVEMELDFGRTEEEVLSMIFGYNYQSLMNDNGFPDWEKVKELVAEDENVTP